MLTGIYTVQANEEAVITRFGGYAALAGPGLHYHLPVPDRAGGAGAGHQPEQDRHRRRARAPRRRTKA